MERAVFCPYALLKAQFLTMLFSAVICLFYGLNRAVLEGQGSGIFPGNFGIDPQLF